MSDSGYEILKRSSYLHESPRNRQPIPICPQLLGQPQTLHNYPTSILFRTTTDVTAVALLLPPPLAKALSAPNFHSIESFLAAELMATLVRSNPLVDDI